MNAELNDVPSDTSKKSPRLLPLSAFIRRNERYPDESFEDYKASQKIQKRVRKQMSRMGSQHLVGYDEEDNMIHWTHRYNETLVKPGTRRRYFDGGARHKTAGDERRGNYYDSIN